MRSILVAHRDQAFAECRGNELRAAGYRVMSCPDPWPRATRCIRCDVGYCRQTEEGDPMTYDPELTGFESLAVDSALAHPDVPLLLAWPAAAAPDVGTLRDVRRQASHIRLAAHAPEALVRQIGGLLLTAAVPEVKP